MRWFGCTPFWVLTVAALLLGGGCGTSMRPPIQSAVSANAAPTVRIRSIVEPFAIRQVVATHKYVFAVTDNDVQRWDANGTVLILSRDHVLGGQLLAFTVAADGKSVYFATTSGITRFTPDDGVGTELPTPQTVDVDVAAQGRAAVALAHGTDGKLWLGTTQGLFVLPAGGNAWVATGLRSAVAGLALTADGDLWIAGPRGLLRRSAKGAFSTVGTDRGCTVVAPRLVLAAPALGGVMVIGRNANGRETLSVGIGDRFTSYELSRRPGQTGAPLQVTAATDSAMGVVALVNGTLVTLQRGDHNAAHSEFQLIAQGTNAATLSLGALPPAPAGATAVVKWGDALVVGTQEQGIAQMDAAGQKVTRWLRRGQLFADATTLSVACIAIDDCWFATGARKAWHLQQGTMTADGPDSVMLAVTRRPDGEVLAFYRNKSESVIHVAQVDNGAWNEIPFARLQTPGAAPEISFARFDDKGLLWVGLRYRDGQEIVPHGVAFIDFGKKRVSYHRQSVAAKEHATMLPIPVGVMDGELRNGVGWFATSEGVARLAGGKVTRWHEGNGLISEYVRAIAVHPQREVYAASSNGLMIYSPSEQKWSAPSATRFAVFDVVVDDSGNPWLGTENGLAVMRNGKVQRLDHRAGLVDQTVFDLATDQFGRIWARGQNSLTIVEQRPATIPGGS